MHPITITATDIDKISNEVEYTKEGWSAYYNHTPRYIDDPNFDLERFNNSEFKNINPKNNNVRFLSKRYYADRNPDIYFENNDIGNSGAYRMSEKYTPIEVSLRTAYKENGKLRPSKILRKPINVKSTYCSKFSLIL